LPVAQRCVPRLRWSIDEELGCAELDDGLLNKARETGELVVARRGVVV
jgi:hypothetical protein